MPKQPDRFAEIRARCDAAIKGPWEVGEMLSDCDVDIEPGCLISIDATSDYANQWYALAAVVVRIAQPIGNDKYIFVDEPKGRANADFIRHARQDIPFLLDQVEKMRKVQVALESLMSRLDNHFGGPERNGDWLEQEKARNVLAALDAEGGES